MLTQAILIGLIAAFGKFDYQLGTLYAFRPIVLCPLVGLVLGIFYVFYYRGRLDHLPSHCRDRGRGL